MNSRHSRGGRVTLEPSSKKQDSTSIRWCFTHHIKDEKSEDELISKIVVTFKSLCKYYIFSIEIGSETKKRHIQGYIELCKPGRLTTVKKMIDDTTHWEKSKGDRNSNNIYCSKECIKGPFKWDIGEKKEFTAEELGLIKEEELYKWQKEIIEEIKLKPLKRKIRWYWSKEGGVGKTEFIKYLMYHHNAQFVQGKKADIMCAVNGTDGKSKISNIYIFGFSRTVEDYVSYDAIESLKDGLIFSGKYESGSRLIPVPHIFVFCNFEPDIEAMSKDRWEIIQIDKNEVLHTDENNVESVQHGKNSLIDKFSINFD